MNGDQYKSPRKNQGWGKQNPFTDELGTQKESDSDQVQDSYHDTGSGWIPFSARDKRPIKISLWDNSQVPGSPYPGRDSTDSNGAPWNAEGETPSRNTDMQANWDALETPAETLKFRRKIIDRNNPQDESELIMQGNLYKKILKISSDDSEWMTTTVHQMNEVVPAYINELNKNFTSLDRKKWSYALPMKDGNTLRLKWKQGSGIETNYFLLQIRYDVGSDTYSVSSSFYDGKTNQESTLQPWSDDIYVDILMDPTIWVRRQ